MVVLTIGAFDILHSGHINLLNACRKLAGDKGSVVVGVNSSRFIESYKGAPLLPYFERATVVLALEAVTEVRENNGPGGNLIRSVRPDLLVVGSDWAQKDYYKQIEMSADDLDVLGVQLVYVPYTPGVSSTEIKKRLAMIARRDDDD